MRKRESFQGWRVPFFDLLLSEMTNKKKKMPFFGVVVVVGFYVWSWHCSSFSDHDGAAVFFFFFPSFSPLSVFLAF